MSRKKKREDGKEDRAVDVFLYAEGQARTRRPAGGMKQSSFLLSGSSRQGYRDTTAQAGLRECTPKGTLKRSAAEKEVSQGGVPVK